VNGIITVGRLLSSPAENHCMQYEPEDALANDEPLEFNFKDASLPVINYTSRDTLEQSVYTIQCYKCITHSFGVYARYGISRPTMQQNSFPISAYGKLVSNVTQM
jgi:hypothetical protein